MFSNRPGFTKSDPIKLLFNVGALLDIPTGTFIKGAHGETILNGGLGPLSGITGRGNSFKSTIAHYMILSAASKVCASGNNTYINTYDTEVNISIDRLNTFASRFANEFKMEDIIEGGIWEITDKTKHSGNEWFKLLKNYLKNEKMKNKEYIVDSPFVDKSGNYIKTIFPSFGQIDSVTEFDADVVDEMLDKNELGESGGNTVYMKLGLIKNRLMMEMPYLANSSAHYMVMTAHLGDDNAMAAGPYSGPVKKLQHLRSGEKIKGISDKFLFLTTTFWQTSHASVLINQTSKGPEYPKLRTEVDEGSSDLNIVTLKCLRNKYGPAGIQVSLIVSQKEGVLPTLTEFHYIKENDRFGLNGNNINFELDLLPGVKLTRPTVRSIIDENPNVRRAIKITADLLQINQYKTVSSVVPTPAQLYEKLSKEYDWNTLLQTRDWWTFNNDTISPPFLSTADLINMYHGTYKPYWLK